MSITDQQTFFFVLLHEPYASLSCVWSKMYFWLIFKFFCFFTKQTHAFAGQNTLHLQQKNTSSKIEQRNTVRLLLRGPAVKTVKVNLFCWQDTTDWVGIFTWMGSGTWAAKNSSDAALSRSHIAWRSAMKAGGGFNSPTLRPPSTAAALTLAFLEPFWKLEKEKEK